MTDEGAGLGAQSEVAGDSGSAEGNRVDVEIFGAVYHVRAMEDPDYLRSLAEIVDFKMREVAEHLTTVDTSKIAVLAALNLADELSSSKDAVAERERSVRSDLSERVGRLAGRLQETLDAGLLESGQEPERPTPQSTDPKGTD